MIRFILVFIVLLLSIWLGVELSHDGGYVLISFQHWTIETTLMVAVIGISLLFFCLHNGLLILNWIIHLPVAWQKWMYKRRIQYAQTQTRQGLIEFSEGHWQEAKKHLIRALPDTDTPLLNYLTAARAAQEIGDYKLRDEYLRQAQNSMPEAKIAVELTQAQLQLANKQWEQALATLRHLQDLAPQHPYVLKLLMYLYEEVKDWSQLIQLLPDLKRQQILNNTAYLHLQQQTYLQAISDLIKQDQPETLKQFVAKLPQNLQHDISIVLLYASYLIHKNELKSAEHLLKKTLRKKYHEDLITLYGEIHSPDVDLSFVESYLKERPHSAPLLLCLGRICKLKELWGKAKAYLEQSIEYGPSSIAYMELGKLLEQLDDPIGACSAYRQGLSLATQYPASCST